MIVILGILREKGGKANITEIARIAGRKEDEITRLLEQMANEVERLPKNKEGQIFWCLKR